MIPFTIVANYECTIQRTMYTGDYTEYCTYNEMNQVTTEATLLEASTAADEPV